VALPTCQHDPGRQPAARFGWNASGFRRCVPLVQLFSVIGSACGAAMRASGLISVSEALPKQTRRSDLPADELEDMRMVERFPDPAITA
jgi:hypothetical protein